MSGAYVGAEAMVYIEAQRTVPAVAAARARNSTEDAQRLYSGFLEYADELGVPRSTAWSIMAAAANSWVYQLLLTISTEREQPLEETLTIAVQAALDWVDARA